MQFVPRERKLLSFVLAKPADGRRPPRRSAGASSEQTGLTAADRATAVLLEDDRLLPEARPASRSTSASRSLLGFIVGTAIAGQTFYLFTLENLKQFGALKAMGVSNLRLVGMILLQALVVGVIGYGLGVGGGGAVRRRMAHGSDAAAGVLHALAGPGRSPARRCCVIVLLASLLSIRRVLVLEPAIVFREVSRCMSDRDDWRSADRRHRRHARRPQSHRRCVCRGVTKDFGDGDAAGAGAARRRPGRRRRRADAAGRPVAAAARRR